MELSPDEVFYRNGFEVRLARKDDLSFLINVCHESFPQSARWSKYLSISRHWWETTLELPYMQTWIFQKNGAALGFVVHVLDEEKWNREPLNSPWSFLGKMMLFILKPVSGIKQVKLKRKETPRAFLLESTTPVPQSERLFMELAAASVTARGKGLGKELIRFGPERARALGFRAAYGRVENHNEVMLSIYKSIGFRPVNFDKSGVLLCYPIENSET